MSENKPSKRRRYTREFKLKVLGEIEAGKSQAQAAREYQLSETAIYKWRQQLSRYKEQAFAGHTFENRGQERDPSGFHFHDQRTRGVAFHRDPGFG